VCRNPYRKGQVIALDQVQKKAAKSANRMNVSVSENLAQRRKILIYVPSLKTEELAWKATGERLQGSCHLSREDQDRKQRTDIGKHSFLHRTIKLWNQLPVEVLATVPC